MRSSPAQEGKGIETPNGSMAKFRLYLRRKSIGVRHQACELPALCVRQCALESGHARQPYAMRHLPECFAFRIVRHHAFLSEKLRWIREHAFRDCSARLSGCAVADCAVLF